MASLHWPHHSQLPYREVQKKNALHRFRICLDRERERSFIDSCSYPGNESSTYMQ